MNVEFQTQSLASKDRMISSLSLTVAALAIALLASVISLVTRHDRIVIVPPGLKEVAKIDWGSADAEYLKSFGMFYTTLMGSITPKNVEFLADRLSSMTAPEIYPQIRSKLLALSKDPSFMSSAASSSFITSQIIYDPETKLVFIVGDNQIFNGFGALKHNNMVYEIDVRMIEGRPVVYGITNYEGTEARTAEWRRAHPEAIKGQGTQQ